MIYQNVNIRNALIEELKKILREGEKVVWRDCFRWHDENGVLSSHYEGHSIQYLCEEFNYELIHNFNHVAVIR